MSTLNASQITEIKNLILDERIKRILEEFLSHICAGNEGYAEVTTLEISGTHIKFEANLHHKHVTKILGRRVVVYSATTSVSGDFDMSNPSDSDLKVCTSTPIGDLCCNLKDIIDIIMSFKKSIN